MFGGKSYLCGNFARFMNLAAILLLGIGLSLDTFAVSLTLGFVSERTTRREKVRFLIVIGLFHFLMILAVGCSARTSAA